MGKSLQIAVPRFPRLLHENQIGTLLTPLRMQWGQYHVKYLGDLPRLKAEEISSTRGFNRSSHMLTSQC